MRYIWKVMYNPSGSGAVPYYFAKYDDAEKFSKMDYADPPEPVTVPEEPGYPVQCYRSLYGAEHDTDWHYEFIK